MQYLSIPIGFILACFIIVIFTVTYSLFNNYVSNNAISQYKDVSSQVLFNYDTYFNSAIDFSNTIQEYFYNQKIDGKNETSISTYLTTISSPRSEYLNISLWDSNKATCLAHTNGYVSSPSASEKSWFINAKENKSLTNFTPVSETEGKYSFILSKLFTSNKGNDSTILKIEVDFTSMVDSVYKINLGEKGHITIYDKNYNFVYCTDAGVFDNETQILKNNVFGTSIISYNGSSFFLAQYSITNTSWRIGIFSNYEAINQTMFSFTLYLSLACTIALILLFIIIYLLAKKVSKPINKLSKMMLQVENANYLKVMSESAASGPKEVIILDKSFISMIQRIKSLMDNVITEQTNQRKAEFNALTNQINPHFLYNTLDSIVYLIDENDNEKASKMVMALAKFFRISISKGKEKIFVEDELEHVRNYCLIQKIRYEDRFNYEIEMEPDVSRYQIIKLILQPLVENSLVHGLRNKDEGGLVKIKAFKKDKFLQFTIWDNGFGLLPESLEILNAEIRDKTSYNGVGLKNIYQRLKIFYGNLADVIIESEPDEYCQITIKIPLIALEGKRYEEK